MPHGILGAAHAQPVLDSRELIQTPVRHWLDVEYFEADPARRAPQVFDKHCLMISFARTPLELSCERDGHRHDLTLRPDVFVLLPSGIRHGFIWKQHADIALIWIEPETMRKFMEIELGVPELGFTLSERITIEDHELAIAARQLCDALRLDAIGSAVLFDALARVFMITLVQKYAVRTELTYTNGRHVDAARYRSIVEYVKLNIQSRISVDDLAHCVGMSKSHFARLFKATVHQSPMEFVATLRVEEAATLLTHTDDQIGRIALLCGFADQAHLTRTFKRRKGVTPSYYRHLKIGR